MAEARKLSLVDLREIVFDPDELAKGTRVFDEGGLAHLARFEDKLYADARGSSPVPYKVQIRFQGDKVIGRCTCMAARTRPFCKHAAALLVAWARAPEAFAEATESPQPDDRQKKLSVKKGKVDAKDLMTRGIEQAGTLVRELAVAGVASLASDRVDQVLGLSEAVREAKLRRVAGRTRALAEHLARAAARTGAFDASDYAELVGDVLLTVRKLEKHLAGEPLIEEHVEELIGKTWTKKDRRPIEGLDLVEYAFMSRTTAEEFVIRESRFFELKTGVHYSEKQILPGFLARRSVPKKSYRGRVLRGVSGTMFPSFPPRRLDLGAIGETEPLEAAAIDTLLDRAQPSVAAVINALQERRRDVFAPPYLPVAMRADALLAHGPRLRVVDTGGAALFLPDDPDAEESLARMLRGTRIAGLLGDVALDGALPTLFPLAAIVDAGGRRALVTLGGLDAVTVLQSRKIRKEALLAERPTASRWADVAREAGVSRPAIVLGEVREEMAQALATGLSSVVPRFADPLAGRIAELGLPKQADLLRSLAARNDPAEKVDDFIKLHQVLGIALTRLASGAPIERSGLEAVPTHESVLVRRSDDTPSPRQIAGLRGAGKLNRYEAIARYARFYASMPSETLVKTIYPVWADGAASQYVARTAAQLPEAALEAARRALGLDGAPGKPTNDEVRATGRVAKLTAIHVLETLDLPRAAETLATYAKRRDDAALTAHAQDALARVRRDASSKRSVDDVIHRALHSPSLDSRIQAIESLADGAHVEAIPILRASFVGDVTGNVRQAAALALARLGDVESLDTFVRMLKERVVDPARAKLGARALGVLGDVRGVDELLSALSEGWQPKVVAQALGDIGLAALDPFLDWIDEDLARAEKKPSTGVLAHLPPAEIVQEVATRLESVATDPSFSSRATAYLAVAGSDAAPGLTERIRALRPDLFDTKPNSPEDRALVKKCQKVR